MTINKKNQHAIFFDGTSYFVDLNTEQYDTDEMDKICTSNDINYLFALSDKMTREMYE